MLPQEIAIGSCTEAQSTGGCNDKQLQVWSASLHGPGAFRGQPGEMLSLVNAEVLGPGHPLPDSKRTGLGHVTY